jgi:hypothetical protein
MIDIDLDLVSSIEDDEEDALVLDEALIELDTPDPGCGCLGIVIDDFQDEPTKPGFAAEEDDLSADISLDEYALSVLIDDLDSDEDCQESLATRRMDLTLLNTLL